MINGNVGAGILNIVTESLYDKPIVVFREYVQNSVDSFQKVDTDTSDLCSIIWYNEKHLYFLDNGNGISRDKFLDEMTSIALSKKKKAKNIGYKGIGRLSGLPYCKKLNFINICSYKNNIYQKYSINGEEYNNIKDTPDYNELEFKELMNLIGTFTEELKGDSLIEIRDLFNAHKEIFIKQDTGFLVVLENVYSVLDKTIMSDDFLDELGWLLPVRFKGELYKCDKSQLFEDMLVPTNDSKIIPAKAYNISFNDKAIERPITVEMLRDYTCKSDLHYAVGFHSFYRDRITTLRGVKNPFSGIKVYLDNILLCDENELLPILQRYGLIEHTANELIQTVKGMGAIIYITDKVNISANARRTFIEVTDDSAIEFLRYLAEFVSNIYVARYALSKYSSGKSVLNQSQEKLEQLKMAASVALQKLATEKIIIDFEEDTPRDFNELDEIEKKKIIRKKLTNDLNIKLKDYLLQTTAFDYENAYSDFITWLVSNNN